MHKWIPVLMTLAAAAAIPVFDPTARLRDVLIPEDAAVSSIIYRLRASDPDFDYPLKFEIVGEVTVVLVDTLNCSRLNSVCQANVILNRRLEAGRFYDFRVQVTSARRQRRASMDCSFRATNGTTPTSTIFPGAPTLISVSENARRNMEIGTLIARGNKLREKAVLLELWGSPKFGLRQKIVGEKDAEGTIVLLSPLDYETSTMHHLTILANDPWTEPDKDTRNIASWPLLVTVQDEQDTPPVFVQAPPTTPLEATLQPGDVILQVRAEDGDRGNPRDIRYGLVPEGNPFVHFFHLDEDTGELRLTKPIEEIQAISHSNTPIILTVVAEEVRSAASEAPSQSSTVKLALIPPQIPGTSPYFSKPSYETSLEENSAQGTQLDLECELIGTPGNIYTLTLENNNGTFDVIPNVIEGRSKFVLKVLDGKLLDYEIRRSVQCVIVARELGDGHNATARVPLKVTLIDVKDNAPEFMQTSYSADVLENANVGTVVLKVSAQDKDGSGGSLSYKLQGQGSEFFQIDAKTGSITVRNQGLDSESTEEINLEVVAEDIAGLTAIVPVKITILDVNDNAPTFEKCPYEFILDQSRRKFTLDAQITALDADISYPNNEIKYEILEGPSNLTIDETTGELRIQGLWNYDEVVTVKVRAYDGGVPRLWSECDLRLYPPDSKSAKILFIVSGTRPDKLQLEDYLSSLIGGRVTVDRLRPYSGNEPKALDVSQGSGERSVAEATVTYTSKETLLDIEKIREILQRQRGAEIQSASSSNLWWLLLLILLLILLTILILVLCCVMEGCPMYIPPKKRRKVSPADIERLVIKEPSVVNLESHPPNNTMHESKSVQVAEWFGRREAWTPDHATDVLEDLDSLRRHELDRGSEGKGLRFKRDRDQYYIREGNADILRLVTRGEQRPLTLLPEQTYVIDGKDIIMRRFIDQQQEIPEPTTEERQRQQEIDLKETASTLRRIQSEHEILEESLRQQNALLRQILMERERDLKLETQSLPAGTQTDQNASTQTELVYLRPPIRRTRSDNDASSEDEEQDYRKYSRKRHHMLRKVSNVKRKIRTPIQEESEQEQQKKEEVAKSAYAETRTSILRRQNVVESKQRSALKREVLQEISDSLNQSDSDNDRPYYSDDSLEDNPMRRKSDTDLTANLEQQTLKVNNHSKASSQLDVRSDSRIPTRRKSSSRYMEWYKNSKKKSDTPRTTTKVTKTAKKPTISEDIKPTATKVSKKLVSTTGSTAAEAATIAKKKIDLPSGPRPEHPLIQHSKNRFEVNVPANLAVGKRGDEDVDSGIALSRPAMAQKKSVFTIAYDDMATKQLPESVSTTP